MTSNADMDRLAKVRLAGQAAAILMRMRSKVLNDKFTVPLQPATSAVVPELDPERGYGLYADRGDKDALNAVLYAAMAPHLNAAIVAATVALTQIVNEATR